MNKLKNIIHTLVVRIVVPLLSWGARFIPHARAGILVVVTDGGLLLGEAKAAGRYAVKLREESAMQRVGCTQRVGCEEASVQQVGSESGPQQVGDPQTKSTILNLRRSSMSFKRYLKTWVKLAKTVNSYKWVVYEDPQHILKTLHVGGKTKKLKLDAQADVVAALEAEFASASPTTPASSDTFSIPDQQPGGTFPSFDQQPSSTSTTPDQQSGGTSTTLATPRVSVVVPVYNSETYLAECVDSIVGQTLKNIEIIFVDDGSTDASLSILQCYQKADARITILTQKNQYAGVARNHGLKHATGKYVVFWDADDYFEPRALASMYMQAEVDDADICVCAANQYFCDTHELAKVPTYLRKSKLPENIPFNRATNEADIMNFTSLVTWNKLYRRRFVEEHNIEYDTLKCNNDVLFTSVALCAAGRITVTFDRLINYRRNQSTSLTGTLDATALTYISAWERTAAELMRRGIMPEDSFVNRVAASLMHMVRNLTTFEAYEQAAGYLHENARSTLHLRPEVIRSEWMRAFYSAVCEGRVNDALVQLMHENYIQALKAEIK